MANGKVLEKSRGHFDASALGTQRPYLKNPAHKSLFWLKASARTRHRPGPSLLDCASQKFSLFRCFRGPSVLPKRVGIAVGFLQCPRIAISDGSTGRA